MIQSDLYLKDINRHIEGVIKADDEDYLLQEVEEYVITKELEKRLGPFFSDYVSKNYNSSAWVSGFFGSGKSHLLKMLSLVLANRVIDGTSCGEIFAKKIEIDFELRENIKKSLKIPTQTLLFNIAQKADGIGNISQMDPILAVFLKVFNESMDYYGQTPAVADVERHLDEEGIFEKFKEVYREKNKKEWSIGRKHILLNQTEFAKAFAEIKGISEEEAKKSFNDLRSGFRMDISGFVELIKKYISKQASGFRLIFCVDEVGQYIADDVRLMLSLQTLAETLHVGCKGQAFLIVTSQNDLNSTLGELNKQQANDFSRIQARFTFKLPLTSSSADEVIQKRLLAKNDTGINFLTSVYEKERNNFRTLFEFGDNSRQYPVYKNDTHFYLTYPFIPYQFDLFQSSIKSLSDHNAFMGKHQSVGERSMLGVFQQVGKSNALKDVKNIVTYSQMYDGIRDILQSNIQTDILEGERNLGNPLAVEVLKALFMVKYVKGFHATLKNIAILLLPSFEVDLQSFYKSLQEALNILENQTYIQRIGEIYEYLTNQEKDIENEIKNTDIEPKAPGELLANFLFTEILKDSKVKLDSNNQLYEFGKKIDDNIIGREKDFYVNFITPLNVNDITQNNIAMKSFGNSDLIVHLSQDTRIFDELRLILKTEKFVQTTNSPNLDPVKQRILSEKSQYNNDRKRNVLNRLKDLIGEAKMYLNGSEVIDISAQDPKYRITQGVQQLIRTTYQNLKMLNIEFAEEHVRKILSNNDDLLFNDTMSEIELEVLNRLIRNKAIHERTTIKILIEFFAARPYGWYQTAVLALIAKLYKRNKINLKSDGVLLDSQGVSNALQSNREYANTIIDIEEDISNSNVKKLKDFHQEYFSEPNLGNEAKEVSRVFKLRVVKEVEEIKAIYAFRSKFAFLETLAEPLNHLKLLAEKEHPYFFNAFDQYSDQLFDDKEGILEPIKKFMGGSQKDIYERILTYLENEKANFSYISKDCLAPLMTVRESDVPYKGSIIQSGKQALDALKSELDSIIFNEQEECKSAIEAVIGKLKLYAEFQKLDTAQQDEIIRPFEECLTEISNERFIGNIKSKKSYAESDLYQRQIDILMRLAQPEQEDTSDNSSDTPATSPKRYVKKENIKVSFSKPALETTEDVESYIKELKEIYIDTINDNTRILL